MGAHQRFVSSKNALLQIRASFQDSLTFHSGMSATRFWLLTNIFHLFSGSTNEDSRSLSIVSLDDDDSLGLTNVKDLALASSEDSNVRITDYNTGAH